MTEINQIYKCNVCGNMVEVVHTGAGDLVCCGQPMEQQTENSTDASVEKHVPMIKISGDEIRVKIGSEPHPMIPEHYIEWIEVLTDSGRVHRKYLNPGDAPEAIFYIKENVVKTREWCNVHGLWANPS